MEARLIETPDGLMTQEHWDVLNRARARVILDQRKANESIRYFKPNDSQKPVMLSDAPIRVFAAPNQVGKTTLGVVEWTWHSMGIYPPWWPENLKMKPPIKVRVSGPDFQVWAQQTLEAKIDELVPPHWIVARKRNNTGVITRYQFSTGSEWFVQTYEQSDQQFESAVYHGAWFDEPPPQSKFVATIRGMVAKGGRLLMTATPVVEGPWLQDLYDGVDREVSGQVAWFEGDIQHNINHLDRKRYELFARLVTEEERDARLYGKIVTLKDQIWKQFKDEIHTCEPFTPPSDVTWFRGIDTHPRLPDAVLWGFCNSHNDLFIVQEAEIEGSVPEVANAIKQMTPVEPQWTVIDPNSAQNPVEWGKRKTVRDEFLAAGIATIPVDDNWALRKTKIDEYLAYDLDSATDEMRIPPKVHIFRTCPKTIRQMKRATYDPQSSVMREKRDPKSKPRQKDMHFPDCLGYMIVAGAHYWRNKTQTKHVYQPRSARSGY